MYYHILPAFQLPGGMNSVTIPTPDQKRKANIVAITLINAAWYLIIYSDQFIEGDRLSFVTGISNAIDISDAKRLKRPNTHSIKLELLNVCRS